MVKFHGVGCPVVHSPEIQAQWVPSGKHKKTIENCHLQLVDLPIKHGDFPYVGFPKGM